MKTTLAKLHEDPILQGTIHTTPWHIWLHEVESAAARLGLDVERIREHYDRTLFRAYHGGEPAWMAVGTAEQLCRGAAR